MEERIGAASLWMDPTTMGEAAASNGRSVRLRKPFMLGNEWKLNKKDKG
jgi:hypothetical protein